MSAIVTLLNSPLVHALGWTLVHFLWQGVLTGAVYLALRYLLRGKSSAARYRLAMVTLAVLAALPVITFMQLMQPAANTITTEKLQTLIALNAIGTSHADPSLSLMEHMKLWLQLLVPWAVPLWLLGVLAMTWRVWRGWRHASQLRTSAEFVLPLEWHAVVESLRILLGIRKLVRLAASTSVTVPSVIGWLKPIILIPPSTLVGLTPLQMELILAHELAHIRRQDYLWNLLQVVVETLLFYHPVVRWVSHQARLEREQCCDDMVVNLHGNPVDYARALTELETLRHSHSALLLGANGGQVLDRIHRLLGTPASNAPVSWLPLLLATGLLCALGLLSVANQKTPLESVLTTRYSLSGTHEQDTPATTKSVAVAMLPTRIHSAVLTALTPKSVPALAQISKAAFQPLPELAEAAAPKARTPVNTSAEQRASLPTHAGGEVLARYAPVYPPLALERGVEGSATVEFTLTPEGAVTDMQVTHVKGSRLFGQAAMDAIHKWKFTSIMVAGQPVAQRMSQEFIFRLHSPATNGGGCKIPMGYHVCVPN